MAKKKTTPETAPIEFESVLGHFPLSKLVISRYNARHSYDRIPESLRASVARHGIIVPLIAHEENGKYHVIDGGARLSILKDLKVDRSTEIPVRVISEPSEVLSILANEARIPMTRLDILRGIRQLSERLKITDIADELCMPRNVIAGYLKMAQLPGPVFEAYEKNEIGDRELESFTLGSHDKALETLKKLRENAILPYQVRHEMTDQTILIDRWPVSEIIEHFPNHGLVIEEDLVARMNRNDDRPPMGRVALDANLMAAYERYYTAWQAEVKAAGYGDGVMFWAEYLGDEPDGARAAAKTHIREHKLSKLHATESDPEADAAMEAFLKKHDIEEGDDIPEHLEEEYAALDRALMADWFPPEKRTNITVICTSGVTEFYAPATEAADTPGSTKADEPAVDPGLTEAAKARLEEIRRHCAAAALAGKPELTMYLLHDALVVRRHYGLSTIHSTSERINDAHLLFSSLAPIEEPSGKPAESKRDRNHDLSLAVGNAIVLRSPWIDIIDPDIRKYWTPDEAWLNTLKKTELVTIGEEIGAKDAFNWASSKKAMVEFLAYAFSGTIPTEYGRSIGDIHAAAKTWLPAYFRRNES